MGTKITGLAPSGSLGSGYNLQAFKRGMALEPDFIGQDAGSTDMGPYYHGSATPFLPRATYKRRPRHHAEGGAGQAKIPLLIGSVLTSGCDATLEIRNSTSCARSHVRRGSAFRMAAIRAEIPKAELKRRIGAAEPFEGLGPGGILSDEVLDRCGPISAQMGTEPFIKALDAGADVIVAGRACDDAVFAALPVLKGFDTGLALHCGKILECAGLSAIPYDLGEPMLGRHPS